MSRRRYLSTEISTDKAVNRLALRGGDFAALLYTWLIPHANDQGIIETQDPEELLMLVLPGRRDKSPEDVAAALTLMRELGLIEPDEDRIIFPGESFYRYQTYIKPDNRRKGSTAPNAGDQRKTAQNAGGLRQVAKIAAEHRTAAENAEGLEPTPRSAEDGREIPVDAGERCGAPENTVSPSLSPSHTDTPLPPQGGGVCVGDDEILLRKPGRVRPGADISSTMWVYESWKMLAHPSLPRLQFGWSPDYHEAAEALIARHGEERFRDMFDEAIQKINSSPFLLGQTEHRHKVTLNWLLGMTSNRNALANVLAGQYDDADQAEPEPPQEKAGKAEMSDPRPLPPSPWADLLGPGARHGDE